jgi:hypothetical protein
LGDDDDGLIQQTFTVTVRAVNDAPTDIALSPTWVLENQPLGTAVGSLSTTDPDQGDSFTYSLVAPTAYPDNAAFTIAGNQLTTATIFDYEAKSSYGIDVRSTDSRGLYVDKAFTITVSDASPVTRTWDGGGNGDWTVGANWVGGTAADPPDSLVFPAGAQRTTNTNDFPPDTLFGSLTFSGGGYDISGNSISLSGGITCSLPRGQDDQLALDVNFTSATTSIVIDGGSLTLSGAISGSGTILISGGGTLNINGPQHWAAGTVIQIGSADTAPSGAEGNQASTAGLNDAVSLASASLPASGTAEVASSRLTALARLRGLAQSAVPSQAVTSQEVPTPQPPAAPTARATVGGTLCNGIDAPDALLTNGNPTSTGLPGASDVAEDQSAEMLAVAATSNAEPQAALPRDAVLVTSSTSVAIERAAGPSIVQRSLATMTVAVAACIPAPAASAPNGSSSIQASLMRKQMLRFVGQAVAPATNIGLSDNSLAARGKPTAAAPDILDNADLQSPPYGERLLPVASSFNRSAAVTIGTAGATTPANRVGAYEAMLVERLLESLSDEMPWLPISPD